MAKKNKPERVNGETNKFLIVGIGASAGGIQALKEFFQHVPADSGMAYVVILHLSPDHDSKLAEVLQVVSAIPVLQVREKTTIETDHIYVVPPNQHLVIDDRFILPSININVEDRRAPVDIFFRNLAEVHGSRAVCVVLSGTGANGSMGLKRIKERGGAAYVQNPREAEYNEMPRNSIATDLVDEVLPVADIPGRIISYRNNLGSVQIVVEPDKRPEPQQQALREIFSQLRFRTGHDFSNYKRPTLLRRIERRINLRSLPDLPAYAVFMNEQPDEATALLKDLLISVTNFFRDQEAFEVLERDVIPQLFHNKNADDQIRIWVAGCATGEEAYTLAMLCAEKTMGILDAPKVQIFATDIDESAIATAREGYYTLNDAADVSPERLRRFFNREGDGFRVRREIRETLLFALHNFLKDPPFSRLDLVTCRNVLIYLNPTAQERVLETFHFALKPKKFLFLGPSESIDGASDLYANFNRDHHIFLSREVVARSYPVPESTPTFHFAKNDPLQKQEDREPRQQRISFGDLHQRLLEQYAPPSVVVNEEYEIVHMTEKAGRYFEFTGGEPTQNLLKLVRPEIRLELRSALYQAIRNNTPVEARNVHVMVDGQTQSLDIHVRPVVQDGDSAKGYILVIFKQNEESVPGAANVLLASDEPVARQLEDELNRVKSQLRSSAEQHEFQAEELKASNEELQAMNEELRSAAEELETSKEELQSINEELRTVNQELKVKIDETSMAGNNLQNLINSADVGTIFLDRNFCIRLFTPAVLDIFNVKPADFGRPVTDITNKLQYDFLLEDAERVLEKLKTIEREVTTTDGRDFMMRLLPYRTSEDRINGVVMTFFDITRRKASEKALKSSEEHLRLLVESAKDYAIFTLDAERHVLSWNTGAEAMMGYSVAEITGLSGDILFTPEDREHQAPEREAKKAVEEGRAENERWHLRKDGSRFWGSGSVSPLKDSEGKNVGFVKIMRDLTIKKETEEIQQKREETYRHALEAEVAMRTVELKDSKELLKSVFDAALNAIMYYRAVRNRAGEIVDFEGQLNNYAAQQYNGEKEFAGSKLLDTFPGVKTTGVFDRCCEVVKTGVKDDFEIFYDQDNINKWFHVVCVKLGDGLVISSEDITKRKDSEEIIKQSQDLLQQRSREKYLSLFNSIEQSFCIMELIFDDQQRAMDYRFLEVNPAFEKQAGLQDAQGKTVKELIPLHEDHWFNIYGEVALTGIATHFEERAEALGRWFEVSAFRVGEPGEHHVAALFNDITSRKYAEERQMFLLKLMDAINPHGHPAAIKKAAVQTLRQQLDADRALYAEFNETDGGASWDIDCIDYRPEYPLEGSTFPTGSFGSISSILLEGETLVVHDIETDARVEPAIKNFLKGLQVFAFVAMPLTKSGKTIALLVVQQSHARHWKAEEITLITDTTDRTWAVVERARAEFALHRSEEKYRNSLETEVQERTAALIQITGLLQQAEELTKMGSWEYDIATGDFISSKGMYDLMGLEKGATIRPELFPELAISEQKEQAKLLCRGIKGQGSAPEDMVLSLDIDGSIRILKINLTLIRDEAAKPVRSLGVALDITAWEQTEQVLRDQAHFISSTNAALPDILFVMNLDTQKIVYVNHSFEEKMGYMHITSEDRRPLFDILAPDDMANILAHIEEMKNVKDGEVKELEYRLIAADGSIRWFRERSAVFARDKDGRPIEKISIAQEFTESKKAEEALKESNYNLKYANENLQQFATIASHDLQEPLRKLRLYTSVLKKFQSDLPEEGREVLSKINITSNRMSQLISEVLQFSKIAYGEREFVHTDLGQIFRNLLVDLELLISETRAKILYDNDLPEIEAIPPQMNQLLYNLMTNALKFRREGVPPVVTLQASKPGPDRIRQFPNLNPEKEYVEIVLSDNGIGFEKQYAEQIFQIFERLHSADEYEGTGVGLALCKKIIENHAGHIYATPGGDGGASFHILLPVKQ